MYFWTPFAHDGSERRRPFLSFASGATSKSAIVSRSTASEALHTGLMYFILQVAITIGIQTDNVVIAQDNGSKGGRSVCRAGTHV